MVAIPSEKRDLARPCRSLMLTRIILREQILLHCPSILPIDPNRSEDESSSRRLSTAVLARVERSRKVAGPPSKAIANRFRFCFFLTYLSRRSVSLLSTKGKAPIRSSDSRLQPAVPFANAFSRHSLATLKTYPHFKSLMCGFATNRSVNVLPLVKVLVKRNMYVHPSSGAPMEGRSTMMPEAFFFVVSM